MPKIVYDAKYWRDRAEEARIGAEQIRNAERRRVMQQIAACYERLAELSSAWRQKEPPEHS